MTSIVRKICLLGDIAVGKTSTVRRFVSSQYDEKYLTTVGVKIDTKELVIQSQAIKLIIWDVAGADIDPTTPLPYLRGMTGYLLVADGTRPESLAVAEQIHTVVKAQVGELPWVGLLNKSDLQDQWLLSDTQVKALGPQWRLTSAKTGSNVQSAFEELAQCLL